MAVSTIHSIFRCSLFHSETNFIKLSLEFLNHSSTQSAQIHRNHAYFHTSFDRGLGLARSSCGLWWTFLCESRRNQCSVPLYGQAGCLNLTYSTCATDVLTPRKAAGHSPATAPGTVTPNPIERTSKLDDSETVQSTFENDKREHLPPLVSKPFLNSHSEQSSN